MKTKLIAILFCLISLAALHGYAEKRSRKSAAPSAKFLVESSDTHFPGNVFVDGSLNASTGYIDVTLEVNGTSNFNDIATFNSTLSVLSGRIEVMSQGPTITAGIGYPVSNEPNGSIYLRADNGGQMFVRQNSIWIGK